MNHHNSPHQYDQFDLTAYDHRIPLELISKSKRNLYQLIQLINRLFDWHSRLLIVRIDLSYLHEIAPSISLEMAQMHRDQLLGDRRRYPNEFKGLLGYAWGLEFGEEGGGFHYHLLLIFDGSIRRDDVGIGMSIQNLWNVHITQGLGKCHISNFEKEAMSKMGRLGIGMIHRDDVLLRTNLIERVASYLTKKCTEFQIQSDNTESGDFRAFGKSNMPPPFDPSKPRPGRPPGFHNWD